MSCGVFSSELNYLFIFGIEMFLLHGTFLTCFTVDVLIVSFRCRGWNVSCGRVSSLLVVRYRVSLIWVPLLPELPLRVGLRCKMK